MKMKLILPLLWIGLEGAALVFPPLFPIVYVLSLPSMVLVNWGARLTLGTDAINYDLTLPIIAGSVIQALLVGCLIDFAANLLKNPRRTAS